MKLKPHQTLLGLIPSVLWLDFDSLTYNADVHDKHFSYYEIQLSFFTLTATMMDMALNQ